MFLCCLSLKWGPEFRDVVGLVVTYTIQTCLSASLISKRFRLLEDLQGLSVHKWLAAAYSLKFISCGLISFFLHACLLVL